MTETAEPTGKDEDDERNERLDREHDDDAADTPREFRESGDADDKGEADEGEASDDDEAPPQ